jgi:hypothetical protein
VHALYDIDICGLSGSTTLFYIISSTARFLEKNSLNIKCVFWFSPQLLSETFLTLRRVRRDTAINAQGSSRKVPLFLSDFNQTWILSTDLRRNSNSKFHENLSSGGRIVTCGRTDRQTDMTKLIIAFRNFAHAPRTLRHRSSTALYSRGRSNTQTVDCTSSAHRWHCRAASRSSSLSVAVRTLTRSRNTAGIELSTQNRLNTSHRVPVVSSVRPTFCPLQPKVPTAFTYCSDSICGPRTPGSSRYHFPSLLRMS